MTRPAVAGGEPPTATGGNGSGRDPVIETLDALRRKGFGRLLVDGRTAVSFDDVEVALLKDQSVAPRRRGPRCACSPTC